MSLLKRDPSAAVARLRFFPLAVEGGSGSWLIEEGGRRLLDLSAGWTAAGLGYAHPRVVAAIESAARGGGGPSGLSAVNEPMVSLAEDLRACTPVASSLQDRRVYLGNGGSDANEVAVRSCRLATSRRHVIAFHGGYHGGLGAAMATSGFYVDAGLPPDPEVSLLPYAQTQDEAAQALATLEDTLGRTPVACAIFEPIQSDAGVVFPLPGFLCDVTDRCRSAGVPVVVDEVKVGLARTGSLHAFQHEGLTPDLVTFGKALGGGLPLSATVGPTAILDATTATALFTTSGNAICAAAGRAVLNTLIDDEVHVHASHTGRRLTDQLRANPGPTQGDIRGRGLTIGVDVIDPATGTPSSAIAAKVVYRAWQLGAVVYPVGGHVLEVTPPLLISEAEVDLATELLHQALDQWHLVTDDEVAPFSGW